MKRLILGVVLAVTVLSAGLAANEGRIVIRNPCSTCPFGYFICHGIMGCIG